MNSVFCHIARTGGTTISMTLGLRRFISIRRIKSFDQEGHIYIGHLKYNQLVKDKLISEEFDRSAYKWTFTRNPYDRAVSQWAHCKLKNEIPDISFGEFCNRLKEFYRVCHPQCRYVDGVNLNFVGRFETFYNDLKFVADIIGKDISRIPKMNATNHYHYEHYYTPVIRKQVEKFYAEDFERFGYEYE